MEKLLLIDGNSLMFRAYFSTAYSGKLMQTKDGFVTNALHGFINMMNKVNKDFDYTHILVAFDTSKKTFRHELLDTYKDGRSAMPDDFRPQIPIIKEYLDLMKITRYELETFEADDIIGTMAQLGCDAKFSKIDIITGDKDLLQLVNDCVTVHITRKGVTELESFTPAAIMEKYEIEPKKMTDLKGLMGDPSDNLPGIPGIGEKTAIKLLKQFGSLEELLERTDELKGKQKENVENNKDLARLCKVMATIKCDMDIIPNLADLTRSEPDTDGLQELFSKMEFNSLLKALVSSSVDVKATENRGKKSPEIKGTIITDVAMLDKIKFQDCNIHFEIFEANYHQAHIIGCAVMQENEAYYIPFEVAKQSANFASFLANPEIQKFMFDAKRAIVALAWERLEFAGLAGDLLLMTYVLNPSTAATDFAEVALHYGATGVQYCEQLYGKGAKRQIPTDETVMANHCLQVVAMLNELSDELTEQLKSANQWVLYQEIELPLTVVLAKMEFDGITLDKEILQDMGTNLAQRIKKLESDIHTLAGSEFNVGSPKQLGVVLFEYLGLKGKKTKTGSYSTSADVLEKLKHEHEIISLILEYRTLTKLHSTYIEGLQKVIMDDGKIHTIFQQAHTQTGRLSSTDPNVQNIPMRLEEGRLIRKAFVASPGNVLIGSDYSQIELRVLAHVTQMDSLITAFTNDEDIHAKTAAEVFGKNINEVTDLDRRAAKAINFGIIYGMSSFGLSESLGITPAEAKAYIEEYLETYSGIKDYMDTTIAAAKDDGYVETLFLRRRYIPEINHNNFMVRQGAQRTAINAPIQGSAADIIKVAMIEVDKLMKKQSVSAKMVLQVHDELLFDVPTDEIELMTKIIQEGMESATKLSVPLKVEASHGKSWWDCK